MIKHYLNLSNGIEWVEEMEAMKESYSFIRIQSSQCEQGVWNKIIQGVSDDFLLNLALGNWCHVYDTSSQKEKSRALFQGLEFLRYVLIRVWFKHKPQAAVSRYTNGVGKDCTKYFNEEFLKLNDDTIRKVKYFRKFLCTEELHIVTHCKKSKIDSKYDLLKEILEGEAH